MTWNYITLYYKILGKIEDWDTGCCSVPVVLMLQGKDLFILFSGKIYLAYSFCWSSVISWSNSITPNGKTPNKPRAGFVLQRAAFPWKLKEAWRFSQVSWMCCVTPLSLCNFSKPLIQILCSSLNKICDFWALLTGLWIWVETQALAQALKQAGWPQSIYQDIQQKSCLDSCRIPIPGNFSGAETNRNWCKNFLGPQWNFGGALWLSSCSWVQYTRGPGLTSHERFTVVELVITYPLTL